ncbi:hypothetical protein H5410_012235 [Solanum commersonii]|uniref:Uncharacterized protein n=1 Tax=Solanum commersonii TaxID=4109 RepID=A0A9J6ARU4_SOLCO|nr:hypothetical protein H5410_012235 [Solanum commersonii]
MRVNRRIICVCSRLRERDLHVEITSSRRAKCIVRICVRKSHYLRVRGLDYAHRSLHGTARASIAEKSSSRRRNRRATGRPPSLLRLSSLLFSSPPARWSNQQLQLVTTAASERRGPPTSSLEKRAAVAIGNNNNNKSTAADFSGAFEDFELIKRWILTDPSSGDDRHLLETKACGGRVGVV